MNLLTQLKKVLATSATVALLAMTFVVSPSAMAFNDVAADAWFAPYVEALTTAGVFKAQDNFRPADNMNRAEFVKTLVAAAKVSTEGAADAGFSDVSSSDWSAPYINAAVAAGIINGSDKSSTFRPTDNVSRAEAVKIALNAFKIDYAQYAEPAAAFTDTKGHWAEMMITAAYNLSIVDGQAGSKTTFDPNASISRSAVAKIASYAVIVSADPASYVRFDDGASAFSVFEPSEVVSQVTSVLGTAATTTEEGTTSEETTTEETTTTPSTEVVASDGTLEVSLSPNSPASRYTPKNAQNVVFGVYDVTANGDDVVLSSLKFTRTGVGSRNDFAGVYVRSNNVVLSNERTINTDNVVEFANLNLTVKAGETVSVEVVANMGSNPSANSQNSFTLTAASMVSSNANAVTGDFPVTSNLMTMSSVGVASLKITSTTKASDPTLGAKDVVLGTLKFENDDTNATDHRVKLVAMTLEQAGSIDVSAIENLGLYDGSTKVATMQGVHKDDYILVFNSDFILNDGSTKTLDLKGDIVDGKANDTIAFALNDNSDVVAVDMDAADVGAYVRDEDATTFGSATYYIHGNGTVSTLTLKAGDVTATFDGPATKDMAWGDKDIVLLESTVTSQRNIEVKELSITLTLTKTASANVVPTTALKNIKLVDANGNTLMGPVADLAAFGFADANSDLQLDSAAASVSATKSLTDSFMISSGATKKVKLIAELSTTADADLTNVASSIVFGASSVKDTDTNKYISTASITPTTIGGKTHNVVSNSLTLATASSPAATTIIKGSKAVKVAGVSLKAGDAGALKVKSVKFTFAGTAANTARDVLNNTKLVDANGTTLDSSNISDGTPDTVTFDGFSYEVAKGSTQLVYLVADVLDTASATDLRANVSSTSDISVIEADGDSLATANISGTPTGNLMTIETSGTFTVSPLTVDSKNTVVQAGTVAKEVARYEFKSAKEKFNVKKLTFDFTGSAEIVKAMKLKVGSVEKTEYSITSNEVTFSNINAEVDGTVQASLFVDFDAMDTNGANTGKSAKFVLAQDNDSAETEVVGVGSSTTINDLTAFTDSSTNKMYVVRSSKVTFTKETTGLVADLDNASSDAVLYLATVANSTGSSVDLGKLSFSFDLVDATNISSIADIKLWINNSIVTSSDATYSAVTAAEGTTNITVTLNSSNKGLLSAGSSSALKLTADVTSFDGATLAVDLLDDDTNTFVLTAKKTLGNIVNGQLDVDADGTTASDADDDLSVVVLNGSAYAVINGQVDVDADGTTASDAGDDLASASINGTSYNVVNGEFDIDADGTTASDANDDLTITRYFIYSDKAIPSHSDTTADWSNGYGLNMDVLTNNSFNNKQ